MNIPTAKYLKKKAGNRLASGREPQKVALYYGAILIAAEFVVLVLNYVLDGQISKTGGLSNIGLRSVLSTAQTVVSVLQSILTMCLNLGFTAAMLRIARRQYASPMTLKAGAERFGVLLRKNIFLMLLYSGAAIAALYLSIGIFMISPLSSRFMAVAVPMMEQVNYDPQAFLGNEELYASLMPTMTPMFILYGILTIAAFAVISYRYRMTDYLLIEKPQMGAMGAMRESQRMMRGNKIAMFKLDLSFWWYYLAMAAGLLCSYLNVLLSLAGITLPLPETVAFFLPYVLNMAVDFAVIYFLACKVEVTYALAYDSLIPHEKNDGVVLGNIFQM